MPLTSLSTAVGSLSISGVPPFNGFWSKLIIIIGAIAAGRYLIAALTILVSFITLAYFVKVQRYALFGDVPEKMARVKESPALMCFSLIVLAIVCLGVGIYSRDVLDLFIYPARDVLLNAQDYIKLVIK